MFDVMFDISFYKNKFNGDVDTIKMYYMDYTALLLKIYIP